jgi:hypothetical protein
MSAITDAFLQNESSKKERENIKIEIHWSLLLLTCENEINFVFGSYEGTTNIALSRDFLLAIISPGVPPVFPPPHAHFFFVQGQCVPGHFQAFFPLFLIALLHSGIEDMTWRCQMRTVRRIMDTVVQWRIVRIWGNNDGAIPYGETNTIHIFQYDLKTDLGLLSCSQDES